MFRLRQLDPASNFSAQLKLQALERILPASLLDTVLSELHALAQ